MSGSSQERSTQVEPGAGPEIDAGLGADPVADPVAPGRPDVVLCPGGPMLVRGRLVVEDADGRRHTTTRPVSAICRCGKTARSPWCDGTHQLLPKNQRP